MARICNRRLFCFDPIIQLIFSRTEKIRKKQNISYKTCYQLCFLAQWRLKKIVKTQLYSPSPSRCLLQFYSILCFSSPVFNHNAKTNRKSADERRRCELFVIVCIQNICLLKLWRWLCCRTTCFRRYCGNGYYACAPNFFFLPFFGVVSSFWHKFKNNWKVL